MNRREAFKNGILPTFTILLGASAASGEEDNRTDKHPPGKNFWLGPDRRQWQRWNEEKQAYIPVELADVKKGDTVLSFDVVDGNVCDVYLFVVSDVRGEVVFDTGGSLTISGSWAAPNGSCADEEHGISPYGV